MAKTQYPATCVKALETLVAEFISPPKVYTFSFIVGNIIPKSVKCIHSATKKQKQPRNSGERRGYGAPHPAIKIQSPPKENVLNWKSQKIPGVAAFQSNFLQRSSILMLRRTSLYGRLCICCTLRSAYHSELLITRLVVFYRLECTSTTSKRLLPVQ